MRHVRFAAAFITSVVLWSSLFGAAETLKDALGPAGAALVIAAVGVGYAVVAFELSEACDR